MKRSLMAVVLVMAVAACSPVEEAGPSATPATTTQPPPVTQPDADTSIAPVTTEAPGPVYLSTLEPLSATVGWGSFSVGSYEFTSENPDDGINAGDPIVVHGLPTPHGLYGHPASVISFDLGGAYDTLEVTLGMIEWISCGDGARYRVVLDGEEIFESPTMAAADDPVDVTIDVAGGHRLDLVTDEGPAGDWYCDWTIWIEPLLHPAAG